MSIAGIIFAIIAVTAGVMVAAYLVVPLVKFIALVFGNVFKFIGREIGDTLRVFGGVLTTVVFIPLVLLSIVVGRWSAASHYGRAVQDEIGAVGHAVYRIFVGNPARLLGLSTLVEGIEQRVPEAMAKAPGRDKPGRRTGQFDGYRIVGSIAGGGSGARLYVAEPEELKAAAFARSGLEVDQVVIKSFSLKEGSSLPQIIREGRALEAAKKIGLVLEHDLSDQRFYYVMPYVPGEPLGTVTTRLHEACGPEGLDQKRIREAAGYVGDLLETLDRYHRAGLWHKDVKPDNIIVHDGRAHLVDLGLVTPLRSAMTLTTHGTEYFRDPELVRMALRGVKVHEVNGVKFDVYAAGAVLYSAIEDSFPAHGGLSHLTKRCPEALRWIVRRSMAEYNNRYSTAGQMLADLQTVLTAPDMNTVKPADLPSMRAGGVPMEEPVAETPLPPLGSVAAAPTQEPHAAPAGPAVAARASKAERRRPDLIVTGWWSGKYKSGPANGARGAAGAASPVSPAPMAQVAQASSVRHSPRVPRDQRVSAGEQRRRAQERARAAQSRAAERMGTRGRKYKSGPNAGVGIALAVFVVLIGAAAFKMIDEGRSVSVRSSSVVAIDNGDGVNVQLSHEDIEQFKQTLRDEFNIDADSINAEQVHEFAQRVEHNLGALIASLPGGRRRAVEDNANPPIIPPAPEPAVTSGRAWLVLDDLGESAPADQRSAPALAATTMAASGFAVIGLGDDKSEIDRVASLKATLGTLQPGDPQATEAVRSWLREHAGEIEGVVWFPKPTTRAGAAPLIFSLDDDAARSAKRSVDAAIL
jgi:serine/threonine protein kinase